MEIFLVNLIITLIVLVGSNAVTWNKGLNKGIDQTLTHLENEGIIEFVDE